MEDYMFLPVEKKKISFEFEEKGFDIYDGMKERSKNIRNYVHDYVKGKNSPKKYSRPHPKTWSEKRKIVRNYAFNIGFSILTQYGENDQFYFLKSQIDEGSKTFCCVFNKLDSFKCPAKIKEFCEDEKCSFWLEGHNHEKLSTKNSFHLFLHLFENRIEPMEAWISFLSNELKERAGKEPLEFVYLACLKGHIIPYSLQKLNFILTDYYNQKKIHIVKLAKFWRTNYSLVGAILNLFNEITEQNEIRKKIIHKLMRFNILDPIFKILNFKSPVANEIESITLRKYSYKILQNLIIDPLILSNIILNFSVLKTVNITFSEHSISCLIKEYMDVQRITRDLLFLQPEFKKRVEYIKERRERMEEREKEKENNKYTPKKRKNISPNNEWMISAEKESESSKEMSIMLPVLLKILRYLNSRSTNPGFSRTQILRMLNFLELHIFNFRELKIQDLSISIVCELSKIYPFLVTKHISPKILLALFKNVSTSKKNRISSIILSVSNGILDHKKKKEVSKIIFRSGYLLLLTDLIADFQRFVLELYDNNNKKNNNNNNEREKEKEEEEYQRRKNVLSVFSKSLYNLSSSYGEIGKGVFLEFCDKILDFQKDFGCDYWSWVNLNMLLDSVGEKSVFGFSDIEKTKVLDCSYDLIQVQEEIDDIDSVFHKLQKIVSSNPKNSDVNTMALRILEFV